MTVIKVMLFFCTDKMVVSLGNLTAKFSQLEFVIRRSPTLFVYFSLLLFTGIEHMHGIAGNLPCHISAIVLNTICID